MAVLLIAIFTVCSYFHKEQRISLFKSIIVAMMLDETYDLYFC